MTAETILEVIQALTGKTIPVADSEIDKDRFENLQLKCDIVEELVDEILTVSRYSESDKYSAKRAGVYALEFINGLKNGLA